MSLAAASVFACLPVHQIDIFCVSLNVIGRRMWSKKDYCDFNYTLICGRKELHVSKFVKNRVLKQIANNKQQNMDNKKFYKTAILDFQNFGIKIPIFKKTTSLGKW